MQYIIQLILEQPGLGAPIISVQWKIGLYLYPPYPRFHIHGSASTGSTHHGSRSTAEGINWKKVHEEADPHPLSSNPCFQRSAVYAIYIKMNGIYHIYSTPHCICPKGTQSGPVRGTRASAFASWGEEYRAQLSLRVQGGEGKKAGPPALALAGKPWPARHPRRRGVQVPVSAARLESSGAMGLQGHLHSQALVHFEQKKPQQYTKQNQQQPRGMWFKDDLLILGQRKWGAATPSLPRTLQGPRNTRGPFGRGGRVPVFGKPSRCPQLACLWLWPCRDFSLGQCFFKKQ